MNKFVLFCLLGLVILQFTHVARCRTEMNDVDDDSEDGYEEEEEDEAPLERSDRARRDLEAAESAIGGKGGGGVVAYKGGKVSWPACSGSSERPRGGPGNRDLRGKLSDQSRTAFFGAPLLGSEQLELSFRKFQSPDSSLIFFAL